MTDIQSKEDYKPVQHPPCQVAVSKAELKRLVELGIIKEVLEYTEWINSIITQVEILLRSCKIL